MSGRNTRRYAGPPASRVAFPKIPPLLLGVLRNTPPWRNILALFLLVAVWIEPLPADRSESKGEDLARAIAQIVERPSARRAFWGIQVVDLGSGRVVYEQNPDKLFVPASNTKLFSTAAALDRLGTDYRFTTSVVSRTPPDEHGVVAGDLILVGGGDPNLSSRNIPYNPRRPFGSDPFLPITELARQLVEAGVRHVEGDIVGDDRRYVWQHYPEGWSASDTDWAYGAPVSALVFNDGTVEIHVKPGNTAGERASLSVAPAIEYYAIDNRTLTARTRTVAQGLTLMRQPGLRAASLWGQISIRSPGRTFSIAVDDPALFAAIALQSELKRLGVAVAGAARSLHAHPYEFPNLKRAPAKPDVHPGLTLAAIESASLLESIRVINKESQNLHAEMLLREVAYARRNIGSYEAGLEELESFLRQAGLDGQSFDFRDASGLSRLNLVTPAATVRLLEYLWRSPLRATFLNALPLAGEDGTLDWRFVRSPARGRLRAKTGTLSHVVALSGYATGQGESHLAFSILVNNSGVSASYVRNLVDKICDAMLTPATENKPSAAATAP